MHYLFILVSLWIAYFIVNDVSCKSSARIYNQVVPCNRNYSSRDQVSGDVQSEHFPRAYSTPIRCQYQFNGSNNERVQINFTHMNLYYTGGDATRRNIDCTQQDSITVYNMEGGVEKELDVFCGESLPPQLMSSTPYLKVVFSARSHGRISVSGFEFKYTFRKDFGINRGRQDRNGGCTFHFNSSQSKKGKIISPNYPGLYPKNTTCHYIFKGNQREQVYITFQHFDVDGEFPRCGDDHGSDYVSFSNYNGVEDRKMQRFCGKPKEKTVHSDGSYFDMKFKTDFMYQGTGYLAKYEFKSMTTQIAVQPSTPSPDPNGVAQHSYSLFTLYSSVVLVFWLLWRS